MIVFLHNREIDKEAWDKCLNNSVNGLIYAYSWYLDIVSPNWCALVEVNYNKIFPLPIKKKFGFSYISQPLFTQQLGQFSKEISNNSMEFIMEIPRRVWIKALQLNSSNKITNAKERNNFELNISENIENIRRKYSQNLRRNLKKASQFALKIRKCDSNSLIHLFKRNKGKNLKSLDNKAYDILLVLLNIIQEKDKGDCYGVFKDGELISAAFFTNCLKRSIYLFSASNNIAKSTGANHYLIDTYVSKYKHDSLILDFEGSMIPSLARFYKSFGSENKKYYLIRKRKTE